MVGLKEIFTLIHIIQDRGIIQTFYGDTKGEIQILIKITRLPHLDFNKGIRLHNKSLSQIWRQCWKVSSKYKPRNLSNKRRRSDNSLLEWINWQHTTRCWRSKLPYKLVLLTLAKWVSFQANLKIPESM